MLLLYSITIHHYQTIHLSPKRFVSDAKALNVTKNVTIDVTIEMKILDLIKENASITTTEMARQLSVNRRTIQTGLEVLKSRGRLSARVANDTVTGKFTNSFCIPTYHYQTEMEE